MEVDLLDEAVINPAAVPPPGTLLLVTMTDSDLHLPCPIPRGICYTLTQDRLTAARWLGLRMQARGRAAHRSKLYLGDLACTFV